MMVGGGPERSALKQLVARLSINVRFTGSVNDEQLREYFATSPIFLTSSHSEGFGSYLLEAMSAGCAAIASDIPVYRELVRDGENGIFITM